MIRIMSVKKILSKMIFVFALGATATSFGLKEIDYAVADSVYTSKIISCFPSHAPPPSENLYLLYESIK